MGGRNTVLVDALSCRIPLVSDIPTIIFGADVTHPENGEETSPSIAAVHFLTESRPNWIYWKSLFSFFDMGNFIFFDVDTKFSNMQVVASQDWPEVTKYAGLVCAQAHRQELIQDLYKTWQDPVRGTVSGGMIRYMLIYFLFHASNFAFTK